MKTDETNNANNPAAGKNKKSKKESRYTVLGESGMLMDEDGNMIDPSEIEEDDFYYQPAKKPELPDSFKKSSFVSVLDDKSNPAYWYHYYDPRYNGPSREEYMERMARKYRHDASVNKTEPTYREPEKKTTKEPETKITKEEKKEPPHSVPIALWEIADREQKAVEREGLRPDFHRYSNGMSTCGIVNRNNEVIVSYDEYCHISYYHNGLARVQKKKTKKFGFVDRHGKEVIPCIWRSAGEFWQYMAAVEDDNRKCGFVDVSGKLVIPCVWKGTGAFSEGLVSVRDDEDRCGFVNKEGKVVIPCRWKNAWPFFEGLAVVQDFNKLLGFINKSGELVIPCRWKKVNYFKDGLAKVSDSKTFLWKDKWVYIDKEGRIVR